MAVKVSTFVPVKINIVLVLLIAVRSFTNSDEAPVIQTTLFLKCIYMFFLYFDNISCYRSPFLHFGHG
jgi:hypothetical protein